MSLDQSSLWGEAAEEDEADEVRGKRSPRDRNQWIAISPLPKSFAAAEVCSLTKVRGGYVLAFSRENTDNGDCITFGSMYLSRRQVNNLINTLKEFLNGEK